MGWRTAIGVTSVAFAGLHLLNPGVSVLSLLVVALAGVVLGLVRWRTQSLPAAWAAHFGWNFALVGIAHATVSGQAFATPSYRLVDDGPSWLTGGTWGPEGGAAAAVALGVAAVCLSKWQPRIAGATDNQTWPTGRMESQQ
jgi:hypothetical protein